jgi:hypothetical protein
MKMASSPPLYRPRSLDSERQALYAGRYMLPQVREASGATGYCIQDDVSGGAVGVRLMSCAGGSFTEWLVFRPLNRSVVGATTIEFRVDSGYSSDAD